MQKILSFFLAASETPATLDETLKIMGQGMLGIFVVMGIIFLVIVILNFFSQKSLKNKSKNETEINTDGGK